MKLRKYGAAGEGAASRPLRARELKRILELPMILAV